MVGFLDKYILILNTTKHILLHPFSFADSFEDTIEDTKRAARYLFEGLVFAIAIIQFLIKGLDTAIPVLYLPFGGEIIAGIFVLAVLFTGLTTHPMAKLFSEASTSIHGSFASFLYWTGFCLFVLPALFFVLITGINWLTSIAGLSGSLNYWLLFAVGIPVLIIYYGGTIVSWIAHQYRFSKPMAVLAILFGYTLSSIVSGPLIFIFSNML